jgi:methylmalonyl-CoA mutase
MELTRADFPPVSLVDWRARVARELGADWEQRLDAATLEGIPVAPLYSAETAVEPLPRLVRPGAWRIWQEVPASAGESGAAALRHEVDRDLGGVWIATGDAGLEEGLSAAHLAPLLAALPLDRVEVAIEGACDPRALAGTLLGALRAIGRDPSQARGCLGCDPLGATARAGQNADGRCSQLVDAALWAARGGGAWRAALVTTAPSHDAGADAAQELGFALATAREYLRRMTAGGLEGPLAARQLLFSTPVGRDVYVQIAKVRALRVLAALAADEVGAGPETVRIHARTSWRTKTRLDPATDLVRTTLEAMAAVLGGCDDLTCAPFLEPALAIELGLPLGSATQLLLREEAGLSRVADPAAGSWYVEHLTRELAARAWDLAEEVDRCGGMARALAVGFVARRVEEAAERRQRALAHRELRITGISSYPIQEAGALPHRPRGPGLATAEDGGAQRSPVLGRDAGADAEGIITATGAAARADRSLVHLGTLRGSELVEAVTAAAAAGATLGDLAAAIPAKGEPLRAPALPPWRDAVAFEGLRRLTERRRDPSRPRRSAVLLRLAPRAATLAEGDLARQVALAAGLEVRDAAPVDAPEDAAAAWRESGGGVAVLVPSRRTPPAALADATAGLRAAGCPVVFAVGRPPADPHDPGAPDEWIHEGMDLLALLRSLLGRLAERGDGSAHPLGGHPAEGASAAEGAG